jgi:hypothetical protein
MIAAYLDNFVYPLSRNHKFHVHKLFMGFAQHGFHVVRARKIEDLLALSEGDIIYISSHFFTEKHLQLIKKKSARYLFEILKQCRCKILLWNFHDTDWKQYTDLLVSSNIVHLGERLNSVSVATEVHVSEFRKEFNVYELLYSSSRDPRVTYDLNVPSDIDFQFVGSRYKMEYINHIRKMTSFSHSIALYPPVQSEIYRLKSFDRTRVSFAFHHDSAIKKGIITERFSEAMSFGNLIIHDHPAIEKDYLNVEGISYVENISELEEKMNLYTQIKSNQLEIFRREVFEIWRKSDLSYFSQCNRILAHT